LGLACPQNRGRVGNIAVEVRIVTGDVPEADWKIFRKIRQAALERFCRRVLKQLEGICADESRSPLDRVGIARAEFAEADTKLAQAFDNPRRSQMLWQLAQMHGERLVEPSELEQFSKPTRDRVFVLTDRNPE
jgi:hypothetical protein